MIKKITFSFIVLIFSVALISGITNGSQAPYGHTGSPGDGKTCNQCHSGTSLTDTNITTNIPASGYVPGTTYTITISVTRAGINKFGFQITAENTAHSKVGSFIITNSAQTKMVQNEVTHTGTGTGAINNSKTWTVDWTAPAAGTGNVSFYTAINAANGNSHPSGDQILTSSLAVSEDLSSSISNLVLNNDFKLYPTVAENKFTIESNKLISEIAIFDLTGKVIYQTNAVYGNLMNIDITNYQSGTYIIQTKTDGGIITKKLIKK